MSLTSYVSAAVRRPASDRVTTANWSIEFCYKVPIVPARFVNSSTIRMLLPRCRVTAASWLYRRIPLRRRCLVGARFGGSVFGHPSSLFTYNFISLY